MTLAAAIAETAEEARAPAGADYPDSATYSSVVGFTEMPNLGDELHHYGWNACSSALCPGGGHDHGDRRPTCSRPRRPAGSGCTTCPPQLAAEQPRPGPHLRGQFADSRRCLAEALDNRRRTGDRAGEATVLNTMAVDLCNQGRFEEALEYLQPVLAIYTALGQQRHASLTLNNIGHALRRLKRPDAALDQLGQAVAIQQSTGDRHGEGLTESTLGDTYLDLARFEDAAEHYRRALAAFEGTAREHPDQADVLHGLGTALACLGRTGDAREAWLTAIPILDRIGDPRAAEVRGKLAGLGRASAATSARGGRPRRMAAAGDS